MKPFLVSYRAQAAVIVAPEKVDARNLFQEKFLKDVADVDKRKIKVAELTYTAAEYSTEKPRVLKSVVLVDGGEG